MLIVASTDTITLLINKMYPFERARIAEEVFALISAVSSEKILQNIKLQVLYPLVHQYGA